MSGIFIHCRAGFEKECVAEIQQHAASLGIAGYCKAKPDSAYVLFESYEPGAADELCRRVRFDQLIFVRQWFVLLGLVRDMPVGDRVAAMMSVLADLPGPVDDVYLETPDTNAGKQLSKLCRSLKSPLLRALTDVDRYGSHVSGRRLHVCLLSGSAAYIGYASTHNSAAQPMGIARLRFPGGAPSRSTLKLDEALLTLLDVGERERYLRPGMQAVDLGAAPGGWTWQLVQRHFHVTAVDNGAMDDELLASGLVHHLRADGFRFQPTQTVDWMVCDMVEQPVRIADLACRWIEQGWCRHTIFNLKLPMNKRHAEVQRCLHLISERMEQRGLGFRLACKQLYHDREEVTVYLARVDAEY